jgi:hypothetical protein
MTAYSPTLDPSVKVYSVNDIVIITDPTSPHYKKEGYVLSSHTEPDVTVGGETHKGHGQRCGVRIEGEQFAVWTWAQHLELVKGKKHQSSS